MLRSHRGAFFTTARHPTRLTALKIHLMTDNSTETELLANEPKPDRKHAVIAIIAVAGIFAHLGLRYGIHSQPSPWVGLELQTLPLVLTLLLGGLPLVVELLIKLIRREFGSDLLAGISIVTSVILGEYLAGALVVLMLSGGQTLEAYAVRSASSVLNALAKRMPSVAHRRTDGSIADVPLAEVKVADRAAGLSPRDMSRRRHGDRGAWRDGRVVPDGRTVPHLEGAGRVGPVGCDQRRNGADDPGRQTPHRFALRPNHAGDAGLRTTATAVAAAGGPTGGVLHAGGRGHRGRGLVREPRVPTASWPCWSWPPPVPCSSPFRWRSSAPSRCRHAGGSSSRIRRSSKRSTPAARPSSTRPAR